MKSTKELLAQEEKIAARRKALKPRLHSIKIHSVQAYEVGNKFGVICGGNAAWFIPFDEMSRVDYPKVFPSMETAQLFIDSDYRADGARNFINMLIERNGQ